MATISSSSSSSRTLDLLPLLCLLMAAAAATNQEPQHTDGASPPVARPAGCPEPDQCGNVSLPYPFGTKEGCFRPGFRVICNDTFHPPRAFIPSDLTYVNSRTQITVVELDYMSHLEDMPESENTTSVWPIELVGVSVSEGKARVLGNLSYDCKVEETPVRRHKVRRQEIILADNSPFVLSDDDNVLMGVGDDVVAEQRFGPLCQSYIPPFRTSRSRSGPVNGSCSGMGCCTAYVPPTRMGGYVTIKKQYEPVRVIDDRWRCRRFHRSTFNPDCEDRHHHKATGRHLIDQQHSSGSGFPITCSYAMIVDNSWYNFSTLDLGNDDFLRKNAARGVPVVVDFIIDNGPCPNASQPMPKDFACVSSNSKCIERPAGGNMAHFCRCSDGYEGNPYIQGGCQDIDECARPDVYPCYGKCKNIPGDYECTCPPGTRGNNAKEASSCTDLFSLHAKISIGVIGGLFIVALLVFVFLVHNERRKTTELFIKNGGLTLKEAKFVKIYKKEELNPIMKKSNFIGRGAFGEVYKGILDNQFVAVKKPIDGNVAQNDQFANEVIIQSQVIHKNIVKLIGCCLQVDKPMLVYEYLSKGSLDDILHGSSGYPLTMEQRLNIAAESAEGLAYMHSKTGKIILHGDVKPANILLDDSLTPKISDFGISRMIVKDKEKTDCVIGDRTYIDPLFILDGCLTDKSDVYSFGVVLLELISRKKATYSDNNSLVTNFRNAHNHQREAIELFDKEIVKPEVLELLDGLYKLAMSCLNLEDVDKRPNMTHVAERLLELKRKHDKGNREATNAEDNMV